MELCYVEHTLAPWFDDQSQVLILGTIPSPKSRDFQCYYGHPQNRFWTTMAYVFNEPFPETVINRRDFVRRHRIALWDVLASCDIRGAEDASITSPVPNDIGQVISRSKISHIFTTGKKSKVLYDKLILPNTHIEAVALPSTSPANRRWCTDRELIEAYSIIRKVCGS